MISGGCSRSVSLSADSSTGMARKAWNDTSDPSAYSSSSSATTSAMTSGWRISSIIAQDAVPLLV